MSVEKRPRVVIIGGGFGGLNATRALAKAPVEIVLIDRVNHHLFQPLLYQVATGALAPSNIASNLRAMLARQRNVSVMLGEVDGIDPKQRIVSVRNGDVVAYDYLVIATGSVTSWFGHADWAGHSTGLKNLADASLLRSRLLGAFERAERMTDPDAIRRMLTFIVVGGGATGVELAGAVRELARRSLPHGFRKITLDQVTVQLFEAGPTLLPGFPDRLARYAQARLQKLGAVVQTGTQVQTLDAEGVTVNGHRIASGNVFWCAGVAATPAARWLNAPTGKHGALMVEKDCSISGYPDVFAIGDVAAFAMGHGKTLPGLAPVAKQQGRYVGRVIAARAEGATPPGPFNYHDQGSLAIVGRAAAVADFPYLKLTGLLAWMLWAGVHLVLLNGLRNRLLVYVQWMSVWLFNQSSDALIDQSKEAPVET